MVNLRHINGDNLTELEGQIEKITLPIQIHSINKVGNNWYIHFLIQGIAEKTPETKKVIAKKTRTKKVK